MRLRRKPTYSAEFKSEAVALVLKQGYSVEKAATNLGISKSALRKWIHKAQDMGLDPKNAEPLEKELQELISRLPS